MLRYLIYPFILISVWKTYYTKQYVRSVFLMMNHEFRNMYMQKTPEIELKH